MRGSDLGTQGEPSGVRCDREETVRDESWCKVTSE